MFNKKYAQISQDACGIVKNGKPNEWIGLFTDSVESCAVYVFEGQYSAIMCHDSGQMSLDKIVEIVSQVGPVQRVQIIRHLSNSFHSHENRKYSLCEKLDFSALDVDELYCAQMPFTAVYDGTQRLHATVNENPALAEPPPDIALRWAVAKLNNAFIPSNSQMLPGNLQFDGEFYLPALKPIFTLQEILRIVEKEPKFFFMNLSVLLRAHKDSALVLPDKLLEFSKAFKITENGWSNDANLQKTAFGLFKTQGFLTAREVEVQ
ncbi:hypothetical protein [Delftia acidovorans]|uniref:hypothetical protein n=1 Tax=Delftia acidovorans TaxID=80866 RepID=UPI0028B24E88|nr:hypothetical protein [Delftia acidovorans]